VAAFGFKSSANTAANTTTLSLSVPYPSGGSAPAVGDPVFLVLRGLTTGTAFTWSPPAGWTEVGAAVRAVDGSGSNNAIQVFWKVYDSGTTVSVTTTTFGTFQHLGATVVYTGTGTPTLVGTVADQSAAASSTFQPTAYTAAGAATVVNLTSGAGVGGTLNYSTSNGFTKQAAFTTNAPVAAWGDQDVSAGSVTMPSFSSGVSIPWMSKTFALDRQLSGWSVGTIKY
jgi:hypothetical protein